MAKHVRGLEVKCPQCKALPGDTCMTAGGNPLFVSHVQRVELALAEKSEHAAQQRAPVKPVLSPEHKELLKAARLAAEVLDVGVEQNSLTELAVTWLRETIMRSEQIVR